MTVVRLARVVMAVAPLICGLALAADDVPIEKDLTAVIALQGLPCGQVVSVKRQAENDYLARCKDGNRYRVYTDPNGRVVVTKQ
jgi:aminoglycoside phosphotransferase